GRGGGRAVLWSQGSVRVPQVATPGKEVHLLSAPAERPGCIRSRYELLCVAGCPSSGFARGLVQDYAVRMAHNSEDEMQGSDLAGTNVLFATAIATIPRCEIRNSGSGLTTHLRHTRRA